MTKPLWITYAWLDNDEGDFNYLVGQLTRAGIPATYDKITLIPGRRLWEQIGEHIAKGELGGWAYLLTPHSLSSQACQEELAYALDRALSAQGQDFPLIGLLDQVPVREVPPPLRIRLCVDLRSPDWIEEVRAGLENRPPSRTIQDTAEFKIRVHHTYLGAPHLRAIEFLPRFGEVRYWRIAYPSNGPVPVQRGIGPANGGGVGGRLDTFVEGTVELDGILMSFFGAENALTPSAAAYAVFDRELPSRIAFGRASEASGMPAQWYMAEVTRR